MADAGVPQAMGAQKCAVSDGGEGAVSFLFKGICGAGGCANIRSGEAKGGDAARKKAV